MHQEMLWRPKNVLPIAPVPLRVSPQPGRAALLPSPAPHPQEEPPYLPGFCPPGESPPPVSSPSHCFVCSCLPGLPVSCQHSHLAMAPACLEPQSQPTVIQEMGHHADKVSALEAQQVRILNDPSKMNKMLLPELPEGLIVSEMTSQHL